MGYAEEKLADLAERLNQATAAGSLSWEMTDDPHTYVCSLGTYSVAITSVDRDGRSPFEIQVIDDAGIVVDSLETGATTMSPGGAVRTPPWNKVLSELYQRAKRNASNADKIVDELIGMLPPVPKEEPPF